MPTLACHVADAAASHLVTGMLTAVPDRGSQLHLARAGSFVLGLAADERLPDEGSICEDRGWAAVVVGTLDDVREQKGGASAAHVEVVEAIFYGEESEPRRSVHRGVFRLGMASYLEWSETGSRVGRYWRPEALLETARLTPGEITERFDELMCRAVRRTLRDRTAV